MYEIQFEHPEVERLDRDGIVAIQKAKLAKLGERLQGSPDWLKRFKAAGMEPRDLADYDNLHAIPTLEKADLRALYPYPMLTVDISQVRRFVATSGTTGLPVMFGLTDILGNGPAIACAFALWAMLFLAASFAAAQALSGRRIGSAMRA